MNDNSTVFDDIMEGLKEIKEYQKGNIQLKTTILEIPDEELEKSRLFYHNFQSLPNASKEKAIQYVEELLQAANA